MSAAAKAIGSAPQYAQISSAATGEEEAAQSLNGALKAALLAHHRAGDFDTVNKLIQLGADPETERAKGMRVMHCAVEAGRVDTVELLLQKKGDISVPNAEGNTPLYTAHILGKGEIFQLLYAANSKLKG